MSDVKPKVLLVCPRALRKGHYWSNTVALAKALASAGAEVEIVAPGMTAESASGLPFKVHEMPSFLWLRARIQNNDGLLQLLELTMAQWQAHRCLRKKRYDVIHFVHGRTIFVSLMALMSSDCAIVNSAYGFPESAEEAATRKGLSLGFVRLREWLLARAVATKRMAWVCETPKVLEAFRASLGNHVYMIPYCISIPEVQIQSHQARKALNLPQDRFILLLFGTHRAGKDYATVLRALDSTDHRAMAFFSGALISDNDPRKVAASFPEWRTAFLDGFVTDEQMELCFAACDFVVIPYESGFERGSGVLLEACRFHKPVLATNTGYLKSFVEEHKIGLLYDSGDAEHLAGVITAAMTSGPDVYSAALDETASAYSWSRNVWSYFSIYAQHQPDAQRADQIRSFGLLPQENDVF
jgi:glycosyltransferase involved in cell wall biosynthesis